MTVRHWLSGAVILLMFALLGCGGPSGPAEASPELVTPAVDVRGTSQGRLEIRLGIVNESQREIAERSTFEGRWQLIDEAGNLRAEGRLYHLGPLDPDTSSFPMSWKGEVDGGSYRLLWGAPSIGSVVAQLTVEADADTLNVSYMGQSATDTFPPEGGYIE
ncbi:MAG: hypothetical protein ACP5JG_11920 [Anaerolineae bacterium]